MNNFEQNIWKDTQTYTPSYTHTAQTCVCSNNTSTVLSVYYLFFFRHSFLSTESISFFILFNLFLLEWFYLQLVGYQKLHLPRSKLLKWSKYLLTCSKLRLGKFIWKIYLHQIDTKYLCFWSTAKKMYIKPFYFDFSFDKSQRFLYYRKYTKINIVNKLYKFM